MQDSIHIKYGIPMDEEDQDITEGYWRDRSVPENVDQAFLTGYAGTWIYYGFDGGSEQPKFGNSILTVRWFYAGHLEGIYVHGERTNFGVRERAILQRAKELRSEQLRRKNKRRENFPPLPSGRDYFDHMEWPLHLVEGMTGQPIEGDE
jgi:hypothetical protein